MPFLLCFELVHREFCSKSYGFLWGPEADGRFLPFCPKCIEPGSFLVQMVSKPHKYNDAAMYRVDSSRDRNHIEPATTRNFEGFLALSAFWSILGYFFTRLRNPDRDPERMGQQKCGNVITFLAVFAVYRVDQSRDRNHIDPATITDFERFQAKSALQRILGHFHRKIEKVGQPFRVWSKDRAETLYLDVFGPRRLWEETRWSNRPSKAKKNPKN